MTSLIFSQLAFYFTLVLVLFLPGYFLLQTVFKNADFSALEKFVISLGSSIVVMDFLIILLGKSPLHITKASVLLAIVIFSAICFAISRFRSKKQTTINPSSVDDLSMHSILLTTILIGLTIFINTIYFKDAIFPTTTDLGHHMYWTKTITTTGQLPKYEKNDIGPNSTLEKPMPIADFIIGEHLIFAAIALVSGTEFISAFPVLTLFLIHIMSLLAIFILTRELFKDAKHRDTITLLALLLIGPLYALASPQAKFASGGVIGNTIGNLLIPLTIFFYLKALKEKSSKFLAFALFLSLGLAYTHHLSTFVFIFLAFFTVVAFALLNYKILLSEARSWLKMIFTPEILAVLIGGVIFIFLIYTPTYLNTKAIDTAVGAPSKATRMGLTWTELRSTAGEARFAFAFAGILLLAFARKFEKHSQAFLIGWLGALTLMSLRPDLLLVDIPSNRIASYIVFPVAIIAAYMLTRLLTSLKSTEKNQHYLQPVFLLLTFFVLLTFIATNGLHDNADTLNLDNNSTQAVETYAAAAYLTAHSTPQDMILKDHNYLTGDSWIKLFFMRGYNYPLSRGYFKRYQDETKNREQCTNYMISTPSSPEAEKCFQGTGTDFLMINPNFDIAQFRRDNRFWQIYAADQVGIYFKSK